MNRKLKAVKEKAIKFWDKHRYAITVIGLGITASVLVDYNQRKEDKSFIWYVGTITDDGNQHSEEWKYRDSSGKISFVSISAPRDENRIIYTLLGDKPSDVEETEEEKTIA